MPSFPRPVKKLQIQITNFEKCNTRKIDMQLDMQWDFISKIFRRAITGAYIDTR